MMNVFNSLSVWLSLAVLKHTSLDVQEEEPDRDDGDADGDEEGPAQEAVKTHKRKPRSEIGRSQRFYQSLNGCINFPFLFFAVVLLWCSVRVVVRRYKSVPMKQTLSPFTILVGEHSHCNTTMQDLLRKGHAFSFVFDPGDFATWCAFSTTLLLQAWQVLRYKQRSTVVIQLCSCRCCSCFCFCSAAAWHVCYTSALALALAMH